MSTQLDALKAMADVMATAMELMLTAKRINSILERVHARGTPWNDADWEEVDAQTKASKDRLDAARKAAGFIT